MSAIGSETRQAQPSSTRPAALDRAAGYLQERSAEFTAKGRPNSAGPAAAMSTGSAPGESGSASAMATGAPPRSAFHTARKPPTPAKLRPEA